jgi:hypothetical protein
MKQEDRIWTLMARRLSQEITAEELQELQDILKQNAELNYTLHVLKDLWKPGERPDREEVAFACGRLRKQQQERKARTINWKKSPTRVNFLQKTFRLG